MARLYAGVDLGTAYIVTAVVDAMGVPLAGAVTRSESSIRDGLVLDYMGAIRCFAQQVIACARPDSPSRRQPAPTRRARSAETHRQLAMCYTPPIWK